MSSRLMCVRRRASLLVAGGGCPGSDQKLSIEGESGRLWRWRSGTSGCLPRRQLPPVAQAGQRQGAPAWWPLSGWVDEWVGALGVWAHPDPAAARQVGLVGQRGRRRPTPVQAGLTSSAGRWAVVGPQHRQHRPRCRLTCDPGSQHLGARLGRARQHAADPYRRPCVCRVRQSTARCRARPARRRRHRRPGWPQPRDRGPCLASHGWVGVDAHLGTRGDWVGWIVVERRSVLSGIAGVRQATHIGTISSRKTRPDNMTAHDHRGATRTQRLTISPRIDRWPGRRPEPPSAYWCLPVTHPPSDSGCLR